MSRGKRVLALAYRRLPAGRTLQQLRDLPRAELESGLTFAGFLIFDCDLKADSKSVIRELKNSDHRVIMITGDSAYTAADVAKRLGMMKPDSTLLVLQTVRPRAAVKVGILAADVSDSSRTLVWRQSDGVQGISDSADLAKGDIPFDASASAIAALTKKHCLCVTGPALSFLRLSLDGIASSSTKMPAKSASGDDGKAPRDTATTHGAVCRFTTALRALSPNVTIFARVSPAQKVSEVMQIHNKDTETII
jgi:magnesium-transporting ATPase (P-type)